MRHAFTTLGLATSTLLLAACTVQSTGVVPADSAPAEPTVSVACTASLQDLSAVDPADFEAEEAAVVASMNACETVAEYTLAAEANPGAWLWTGPEFVDPYVFLLGGCTIDLTTAVCRDATELGLIDADGVPTFDPGE
jgi:hypothetical protein